ncbi:ABC transporter permease [Clostridium sp. UBA1652]|uniref:ABC transporter permease n=1 Tax=Clostridium sp. UBA1652 TaxID=1946348 RepID=UPI00258113A1|nr:ABC transporter permease [Clostridium sp. UBA1652]
MAIKDRFTLIGINNDEANEIRRPTLNYWQDAWRRLKQNKLSMIFLFVLIAIIFFVLFGTKISSHGINDQDYSVMNQGPSSTYWFGTDALGRDMFARVWAGGRVSLSIGIIGMLIELLIGCLYGAISGYLGGKVDNVMMRIVEVLSSVPYEILVMLFLVVLPKGTGTLILALCITGWLGLARMIRGQVMQLKESEYVLASRALGQGPLKIVLKHLLPNTISTIIVYMTMDVPALIFAEAYLGFLGLGVQAPNTSWGVLISQAQSTFQYYPHQMWFPAGVLCLTALSFNLVGEGLRDALDPKLRQ